MRTPTKALYLLVEERTRQQTQEGYTTAHDDEHTEGQLALPAAAYALSSRRGLNPDSYRALERLRGLVEVSYGWPFKPKDPIRDLARAGALILAELERRLRAEEKEARVAELEAKETPPTVRVSKDV